MFREPLVEFLFSNEFIEISSMGEEILVGCLTGCAPLKTVVVGILSIIRLCVKKGFDRLSLSDRRLNIFFFSWRIQR